jgi:hypothetical protein
VAVKVMSAFAGLVAPGSGLVHAGLVERRGLIDPLGIDPAGGTREMDSVDRRGVDQRGGTGEQHHDAHREERPLVGVDLHDFVIGRGAGGR